MIQTELCYQCFLVVQVSGFFVVHWKQEIQRILVDWFLVLMSTAA